MKQPFPICIFLLLLITLTGCIESYSPQLNSDPQDIYVVTGGISSVPGYQEVMVSKATSLSQPINTPVTGCQLYIEDDRGNSFSMEEYESGRYHVWIDQAYLEAGVSYRLHLTAPSGDEILSDYDLMPKGPGMDSLYYVREEHTDDQGVTLPGLQFYVSFNGNVEDSRYFHWSVVESWEYHSPYVIEYYYNGSFNRVLPPDSTYRVCWETRHTDQILNLSTKNLARNGIGDQPLHFVDNSTTKLFIGYSVLIGQHVLSEPAYTFWEQLRVNSESTGGLYDKQPLPVEGNLHNITHSDRKVLGFFQASSLDQRRIFIPAVRDMGIRYDSLCSPIPLGRKKWKEFTKPDYPVYYKYFTIGDFRVIQIIDLDCIDCRKQGGSLTKPEFWPE